MKYCKSVKLRERKIANGKLPLYLAYFKHILYNKDQKWEFVYKHFVKFVDGHFTCGEVDLDLCQRFRSYLLNARNMATGQKIHQNSAAGYWSTFRGFLNVAYKDRMIEKNPNDRLEKIEYVPTEKDSLTLEEVRKLYATPCEKDVIRRAALFSCLTGLRRSDVLDLTWNNICK